MSDSNGHTMVEMRLGRIVIRDGEETQYIYLNERGGDRGFPIVIGSTEAREIHRVLTDIQPERPLTHQLTFELIGALGSKLERVDIVDLRNNTFYAQLILSGGADGEPAVVDARPSDALALALRAGCPLRVSEAVLEQVRTDQSGPDPLPEDFDPPSDPPPATEE